VDAAVTATDARVYASRFTVQAPAPAVSFSQDILPIFNSIGGCTNCHVGSFPSEGLNLTAGQAFNNLVNVASRQRPNFRRVLPGNANDSYIVMKLTGDTRITGARMPFGGRPLSEANINLIRQWINANAPNN
jgi:hypothetical protein